MLPTIYRNAAPVASQVNRLSAVFDRLFNDELLAPLTTQGWSTLPLGMWQDEHNLYAEIDTPGLTEKDIDVCVHDGELIIRGERKCERQGNAYDNRRYGRFDQRIILPTDVDAERVEARLSHGVLSLTLPKSEAAKPHKIAIQGS